jgi:hypothetical protein
VRCIQILIDLGTASVPAASLFDPPSPHREARLP